MTSPRLKRLNKFITQDDEYSLLDALLQRKQNLKPVIDGINSPFGTVLLAALKDLETSALEEAGKAKDMKTLQQAQAELKTARYLLKVFESFKIEEDNVEASIKNIRDLQEESDD